MGFLVCLVGLCRGVWQEMAWKWVRSSTRGVLVKAALVVEPALVVKPVLVVVCLVVE